MCTDERISHVCKNITIPLNSCMKVNKNDEGVNENESSNWIFKKKLKEEKQLHYDEDALF